MDLKVSAQRLCMLLSWQEKLGATPEAEAYAGRGYRRLAERAVTKLRGEAQTAIEQAGSALQEEMASSSGSPRAEQLRHRIQQLNHLLKARRAEELGGPIAMSLEDYAETFGARKSTVYGFTRLERTDYITIVTSIVLVSVICLGLTWYKLWRQDTSFAIAPAGADHVALTVKNDGQKAIEFIGSWPTVTDNLGPMSYGVSLHCKEQGAENFQPATSISEIWLYQNEVLAPRRYVAIEPGVSITVLLDLKALSSAYGAPLESLRLECGTLSRRRQVVFTQALP
jgi:hypothetical protein